jgi:sugar phosphate isomerase/epimerase
MAILQPSRRGFLGGAFAAAGLAGAAPPPPEENAPGGFKLGIATYSLREFQRGLAIRMIRQLGISYASVKEFHLPYRLSPEELAAAAKEFERGGVTITSGGVVYFTKDEDSDVRRYFDYARTAGMPMLIIMPTHQVLPRIERFVKEYNIAVAIHNHGPEDKQFPTPEAALKAVSGMDPRVGVCIDVGHTARAGVNPVEAIRAAGPRLLDVHIKDLRNFHERGSDVPVGDGAMPIVAIFQELRKMNYRGFVNLEYEIDADNPIPGMSKSIAYMRGVLAGLRG